MEPATGGFFYSTNLDATCEADGFLCICQDDLNAFDVGRMSCLAICGDADGAGDSTDAVTCPSGYAAKSGTSSTACAGATCDTSDASSTDTDRCCAVITTITATSTYTTATTTITTTTLTTTTLTSTSTATT